MKYELTWTKTLNGCTDVANFDEYEIKENSKTGEVRIGFVKAGLLKTGKRKTWFSNLLGEMVLRDAETGRRIKTWESLEK